MEAIPDWWSVGFSGSNEDQRRRRDSNPRYREAVHRFSRPALSTTQAPLRKGGENSFQFRRRPSFLEEQTEDFSAFPLEDSCRDLGPMVQPPVRHQAVEAGTGT